MSERNVCFVESEENPLAIGTREPCFSWVVPFEGRNRYQTGYRILVASTQANLEEGVADCWDSGRVESGKSMHVSYAGTKLISNSDYYWSVELWGKEGAENWVSSPQIFGTSLFSESDWEADWIGMGPEEEPKLNPYSISQEDATKGLQLSEDDFGKLPKEVRELRPELRSPQMRKDFSLEKHVARARAYVCGLGLFEFRLNGSKVGEDVLTTPRTDYGKRVYYFSYDITRELQQGLNTVGLILGGGWFNAQKKFWHWQAPWFGSPRALVQLEIDYEDGTKERVMSDQSWRGDWSPILMSCIYDGEDYDARLEQGGWDQSGFDAKAWPSVNLVEAPTGRLVAMDHQPNRVMDRWAPVRVSEPKPGVHVYDMGKVMTGWCRLRIPQGRLGEKVVLRYSELLYADGMIAPEKSCGGARQAEHYIMKGAENEGYEPRFTYHGFRYVEVTGFPSQPELNSLEACFVHQGVEEVGRFECGHDLINKIHACTLQSQRCNLQMGVPTDDTQREERLGWSGDAWSYAEESIYNLDVSRFWGKWIGDNIDQQSEEHGAVGYIAPLPGWQEDLVWSAAFVLIPWWHYQHYGDRRMLESSYPALKKYVDYLERTGRKCLPDRSGTSPKDFLFPAVDWDERYSSEDERGYLQYSLFGDHLATNEGGSGMGKDQPHSMATAFYHMDVVVMTRIAEALGQTEDAQYYKELSGKIRDAFNEEFFDAFGSFYDVGCQSAQALAVCFDLVPEEHFGRVLSYLNSSVNYRQKRITTGYASTKWLIKAIAEGGRNDIIWTRAISTEYPSWGYMLKGKSEAGLKVEDKTTICENWQGNASQCHTTLGAAIDEWFYWGLAGIRPDSDGPGYEKVIIRPYLPSDLPWARASIKTLRGTISSEWAHEKGRARLEVKIPSNTHGKIYVPSLNPESVVEGGVALSDAEGVSEFETMDGHVVIQVGSGSYVFEFSVSGV